MKDRLMMRDISPFFWASSKGGIYQRALRGYRTKSVAILVPKIGK